MRLVGSSSVIPSDQRPIHTMSSIALWSRSRDVLDGVAGYSHLRKCEVELEICLALSWHKMWSRLLPHSHLHLDLKYIIY